MTAVAVAGGSGDLGRLITNALLETGKYEVYIMSRKVGAKTTKTPLYDANSVLLTMHW